MGSASAARILALASGDVQKLRTSELLHVVERRDQRLDVVAVDRSDVIESHLLEQRAGSTMPFKCSSERRASSIPWASA